MFLERFPQPKPIMAMLHLKGDTPAARLSRALVEADTYIANGVDALIVEDYFGGVEDVERVLSALAKHRPAYTLGVNVLDDFARSYELARKYGAAFMQVDSICGHLDAADEPEFYAMVDAYRSDKKVAVIGGVRFKYQPLKSTRSLQEDLTIAIQHCDAIAVTGAGTGVDTDTDKIREFRAILGNFPLIVGAGMTAQTAAEKLAHADGAIVGSTFKDTRTDNGEVSAAHVRAFMDVVNGIRSAG